MDLGNCKSLSSYWFRNLTLAILCKMNCRVIKMGLWLCTCMCAKLLWLCLTLCEPMDFSPLGSSVHGILQARILEWVAIPFSTLTMWITTNCGKLKDIGLPDHLTCLLRNLYVCQEATVRTGHGTINGSELGKKYIKAIYCHPAYLTYTQSA